MRLHIFCLIVLALVVGCKKKSNSIKVEYKPMIEAVYASGTIVPANEYKVFAIADGYLLEKLAEAGDEVKQGQVLFQLDGAQQLQRTLSAKQAYDFALNNSGADSPLLNELRSALKSAKLKRDNDSINFFRIKNLFESQVTTKAEYDKAQLVYSVSSNDYAATLERFDRTKEQLKVDLQNAQSQYFINQKESDNYGIKSLIDGRLYDVYKERGELVRRGEAIALIGDKSKMNLQLLVDEQDIQKIKTGQQVEVKVDAIANKLYKATITKIYPMERKQDQSFRVDATFTADSKEVMAGMSVEANIIISQKEKTLVIPKNYMAAKDSVWISRNGTEEKIKINTGIENFDFVEVLAGVNEGDEVLRK